MKVKEKVTVSKFDIDDAITTQLDITGEISEEEIKRFGSYARRIAEKNMLLAECLALISGMCEDGGDELLEDLRKRIENHLGIVFEKDDDIIN